MDAEQLARALNGVRSGRQWKCRCVAHEDRSPSMIIFDGRESVQVRCLAGCDQADIIGALKARGLWHIEKSDHPIGSKKSTLSSEDLQRQLYMRNLARRLFEQAVPWPARWLNAISRAATSGQSRA
jgi:hypothetical protein